MGALIVEIAGTPRGLPGPWISRIGRIGCRNARYKLCALPIVVTTPPSRSAIIADPEYGRRRPQRGRRYRAAFFVGRLRGGPPGRRSPRWRWGPVGRTPICRACRRGRPAAPGWNGMERLVDQDAWRGVAVRRVMIFTLVLGVVGVGLGVPAQGVPGQVRIDAVREWNGLALNAVRLTRASDSDSARVYAMLNVALYDTVNGLAGARQRTHAVVPESGPAGADVQAAGVAAAHSVLSALDPDRAGVYDSHLSADLAQLRPGRPRDLGVAWGQHVGQAVVAARADDGSRPVQIQPAGSGPGVFRADWSGVQFGQARPFAVADAGVFVPGPPPALDSLDYAAALADVSVVGNAALPDPAKLATFQFWSLPAGSVQPPGEWVKIALEVSDARTLPLDDSTRLLALLSMALFDTAIVTTRTKSTYRHW